MKVQNLLLKVALCSFSLVVLAMSLTNAQSWVVGQPVNMQLSSLGHYTGGCYPTADFNTTISGSPVSGVSYYVVINSVQPNSVYITPGNDTIATGDSIKLTPGINTISFYGFGTAGLVDLIFVAMGTPTTAGQAHPCAANNIWLSNLLLCDEGLSLNLQNNCTVLSNAGLNDLAAASPILELPNAANNYQLSVTNINNLQTCFISNTAGIRTELSNSTDNSKLVVDCNNLVSGIYFVSFLTLDNKVITKKINIHRQ